MRGQRECPGTTETITSLRTGARPHLATETGTADAADIKPPIAPAHYFPRTNRRNRAATAMNVVDGDEVGTWKVEMIGTAADVSGRERGSGKRVATALETDIENVMGIENATVTGSGSAAGDEQETPNLAEARPVVGLPAARDVGCPPAGWPHWIP